MLLSFVLVFMIGFAAHRASLCTVRAVMQWVDERQTSILVSFTKAVAWACWLAGVFVLLGLPFKDLPLAHSVWWLSVVGGFLFGIGAAINGGCSLSTLQKLADGDASLLLTLAAFVLGVALAVTTESHWLSLTLQPQTLWWVTLPAPLQWSLVAVLTLWAARELTQLWRSRARDQTAWQRLLAPRYSLAFSAMLLGVFSGLLFLLEGMWTYTNYLRAQTSALQIHTAAPGLWRAVLLGALFLGMLASSLQRRSYQRRALLRHNGYRRFFGGLLMGAGSALVPGGNDTLLLVLIPTLSLQALASYLALLAGVASVMQLMRRT